MDGTSENRMRPVNLRVKVISKDIALRRLKEREGSGMEVDDRLRTAIEIACVLLDGTIQDKTSFLSLIWHEIDGSRILTPSGQPRTLRDVARRMIENGWTFDKLSLSSGTVDCDPNWFSPCLGIYGDFDHGKLGWFAVTNVDDDIYRQSPNGSLYIYDGCHKALVYAYRLLTGVSQYEPVPILWLLTENGLDLPVE